ncbi:uncharacterized protein LOC119575677 [Penaeus monodon]|uniref:uncharacterized protein LOC119575677 n=1 Tax=Penaeus monodon TaxID=6687 RepID=UPI0018A7405F|nr:uncharacterized protein LOC119575677 [Penaeus monodon]
MLNKMKKVTPISLFRVEITLCIVLSAISVTKSQFRNDQDQEYYRYNRDYPGYTTPHSVRSQYNSGDTYYGTDRRYDTRFDDPTRVRGFDNRYQRAEAS